MSALADIKANGDAKSNQTLETNEYSSNTNLKFSRAGSANALLASIEAASIDNDGESRCTRSNLPYAYPSEFTMHQGRPRAKEAGNRGPKRDSDTERALLAYGGQLESVLAQLGKSGAVVGNDGRNGSESLSAGVRCDRK